MYRKKVPWFFFTSLKADLRRNCISNTSKTTPCSLGNALFFRKSIKNLWTVRLWASSIWNFMQGLKLNQRFGIRRTKGKFRLLTKWPEKWVTGRSLTSSVSCP